MAVQYPGRRTARSKFLRPGMSKEDRDRILTVEMRQVARAIEEFADSEGSVAVDTSFPFYNPEDYGWTDGDNGTVGSSAVTEILAEIEDKGGGILLVPGSLIIAEPIIWPDAVFNIWGFGRSSGNGWGQILSESGDFDMIKIPYGRNRGSLFNLHFGMDEGVTPTHGVMLDGRWWQDYLMMGLSCQNMWLGCDLALARSGVIKDFYGRGFAGTETEMGTGAPLTGGDMGFCFLFRCTQDLTDGNEGVSLSVYDRDGPGVEYEPKSKGTSNKLYNVFINGKDEGEDDNTESVSGQYKDGFAGVLMHGASTVRMDTWQIKHCYYAIYGEMATTLDENGDETGKNMLSGFFGRNGAAEGNYIPYYFDTYEKISFHDNQCNASAKHGLVLGNPDESWPGDSVLGAGETMQSKFGGHGTFKMNRILSCGEKGIWIRSGSNTLAENELGGYSGNKDNDIATEKVQNFEAATSSDRIQLDGFVAGTYVVHNNSAAAIWIKWGNASVVATTGDQLVAADTKKIFDSSGDPGTGTAPTGGQNYMAFIAASGSGRQGSVGPQAIYDSPGIHVDTGDSEDRNWIRGGAISESKSMKTVGSPGTQGAIRVEAGVHNVDIRNVDVMEGGIVNLSTETDVVIRDLINSAYSYPAGTGKDKFNLQTNQGGNGVSGGATTAYYGPAGNSTTDDNGFLMTRSGVLTKLYCRLSAAPGASQTHTITVYKNGSSTGLAVTISGASATTGNDTDSVSFAAGDRISFQVAVSAGAAANVRFAHSVEGYYDD